MPVRGEIKNIVVLESFADISFLGNTLLFSRVDNDCQCDQVCRHKVRKSKSSMCVIQKQVH